MKFKWSGHASCNEKITNSTLVGFQMLCHSNRGVVVLLQASERKVWSSKLHENIIGIRQEGHPELKCYVAPTKSLVRKRVCGGRHTLNQHA